LEKDPNRRYQSAAALAEDIERFMSDMPVLARRGNALYILRKFIVRYRLLFFGLSGLGIVFAIMLFTINQLARSQRSGIEETLALKDLRNATTEYRLAQAYLSLDRPNEAEPWLRTALDAFTYLQRDELAAPLMVQLAELLMKRPDATAKDLNDAEDLLLDAEDIYIQAGAKGIDARRRVLQLLLDLYGPDLLESQDGILKIEQRLRSLDVPKSA
jgi:hypothetical protein